MGHYYTYIATNKRNTVLYTGATNDLERRMLEHMKKRRRGFTSRYNVSKLVWYKVFNSQEKASTAEKRIKGWTRVKKIKIIKSINPEFGDLLSDLRS